MSIEVTKDDEKRYKKLINVNKNSKTELLVSFTFVAYIIGIFYFIHLFESREYIYSTIMFICLIMIGLSLDSIIQTQKYKLMKLAETGKLKEN